MPASYSAADMGVADFGGGPEVGHGHGGHGGVPAASVSVTELVADQTRAPDVRVEVVARFDGERYTLDGATPGPVIRARQGDLVEVVLRNESVPDGATLHWHGMEVPNAMDGVAGVTQDAVGVGESFTYRFVADRAGTFWYHSHQVSHIQVVRGLFGAVVVEPVSGLGVLDEVVLLHTYPGSSRTMNGVPEIVRPVAEGDAVRVRLANTDNVPTVAWVSGASYRVVAVDGYDLNGPGLVDGQKVTVTAGGRVDLEVVVPAGGVRVQVPGASLALAAGGVAPTGPAPSVWLDLLSYGTPAALGFDPAVPDRRFVYDIGRLPGFLDGLPGWWWTINGRIVPHQPMYMVSEGDVVVMKISNASGEVHPMHLHGHHMVVLARNGVAASGSPWWVDSLHVEHGESYDVAFVADNPGVWMDHCHNLIHAREGLMTHLMYTGIDTPFRLGHSTGNVPE